MCRSPCVAPLILLTTPGGTELADSSSLRNLGGSEIDKAQQSGPEALDDTSVRRSFVNRVDGRGENGFPRRILGVATNDVGDDRGNGAVRAGPSGVDGVDGGILQGDCPVGVEGSHVIIQAALLVGESTVTRPPEALVALRAIARVAHQVRSLAPSNCMLELAEHGR